MYNEDAVGPTYSSTYFHYWFTRVGKEVFTKEEYQSIYDQMEENEDEHIYINITGILPNQGRLRIDPTGHYAYFSIYNNNFVLTHYPNWYNLLIENLNQRAVS